MKFPKPQKEVDPDYLLYIRTQPCAVLGCQTSRETIVPHHVSAGGMGTKCSDYRTIPLCYIHHNFVDTKGKKEFAKLVDVEKAIERLREKYEKETNDKILLGQC